MSIILNTAGLIMRFLSMKTVLFIAVSAASAGPARAQWSDYDGYQYSPPRRSAYPYPAPPPAVPYQQGGYGYYGNDPGNAEPMPVRPQTQPYGRRAPDPYDPDYTAAPYQPRDSARASLEPSDLNAAELSAESSDKTAQIVPNPTHEPAGTIVVDTRSKHLYLVQADGQAVQYGIGVGRQGFEWKGEAHVQHKSEWPDWYPPKEMLKRRPDLPEHMEGGIENPLGARALYLYQGNKDTLFRIHGTNEPDTIGKAVSSGCIRMMNADVIDLYKRVPVGTRVVVL